MGFKGSKYEAFKEAKLADVANAIRADLKEEVASGGLPPSLRASVRISHYSMGCSVTIRIVGWDGTIANGARLRNVVENPHAIYGNVPLPLRTAEASDLLAAVKKIANAYNRDDSDPASDYYSSHFHLSVVFDHELEAFDRARVAKAIGL